MGHKHPQGNVFYRKMAHERPMIARGEGVFLFDTNGKRYLDASGGPLVVNVGHGREEVVEAMREQASKAAYVHGMMFTSQAIESYCDELAPVVPLHHPRFFLLSSGSEVIEAAIKLARQIQQARGETDRHIVVSRSQSYHGTTLGALSASGRHGLRAPYVEMMQGGTHVDPPYAYRDARSGEELAGLVEQRILELGAARVAAFLAEPISGASLGAAVPDDGYWPRVREICDRHGVLLIADEVLVGLGRTGRWWALDRWGVRPDILVASKGTAGGYMPMGFVAAEHEDVEQLRLSLGDFNHGGTFSHHAVAAAAGLAVLRILRDEQLVVRARDMGELLDARLREELSDHPHVGDIRGDGLFRGVELVADRDSKRPFSAERHVAAGVHRAAFDDGLVVYYSQGCADGQSGDVVMVGPPFILEEDHVEEIVTRLRRAIDAVTLQR
jgi:adenosylmethionine-8-amino-7-oxononanoate aminotransferase